jgi:hypothetical protein
MGLDTSHDCWSGAYSAFSRWRDELARAAGYTFRTYPEDPMPWRKYVAEINWDALEYKNYQGEWDRIPEDPLILLLAHSDCDGEIKPEHALLLADRLEQLLPALPDESTATGHIERCGWRGTTQRFIDGLRQASAAGEAVDFH